MDGGIQPARPEELGPNETMGDTDGSNGALFIGTKGKMVCGTYGVLPTLLPKSKTQEVNIPQTIKRVPGNAEGHYAQWVEACIAGYGKMEVSSPFETAGPLTETILMGNLAIRSNDIRTPRADRPGAFDYPGKGVKLLWNGNDMKITNFEAANAFVKREYRSPYSL